MWVARPSRVLVAWISHRITRAEKATPARQTWTYADLALVIFAGLAAIVFFYSGTFFNWAGLKGLYGTFDAWFKTGSNGNGHEKPWHYWLMLTGRYEAAAALGLIACVFCQFFRQMSVRYIAIYGVGTLAAYSIVHYKTPWCIISIVWPFLFTFGAGIVLLLEKSRRIGPDRGGSRPRGLIGPLCPIKLLPLHDGYRALRLCADV